ncbi:hypothetical protein NKOR_07575 [Candidatus Nitrosopumilus koreensis AR1]|uniref:Uncharacterized protein n=1 Tax=Candidatus Nitrosopumilus koreensis AR1 TaxID=1229908 RepID=K0BAA7_9ARCH|nr:hypothetical protein NKOR_07575 [Candidatus Nitrosopumilus koreensis AR1]
MIYVPFITLKDDCIWNGFAFCEEKNERKIIFLNNHTHKKTFQLFPCIDHDAHYSICYKSPLELTFLWVFSCSNTLENVSENPSHWNLHF